MIIDTLKSEYDALKQEKILLDDELSIMQSTHLKMGKIYRFLKQGKIVIEPVYIDENGEPKITNQDDIDLMSNIQDEFSIYLALVDLTKFEFIMNLVIARGRNFGNGFSKYNEDFQRVIRDKRNEVTSKANEITAKYKEITDQLAIEAGITP